MASNRVNLDVSEKLDITFRKGDTFEMGLTFLDSEGEPLPLVTDGYEFLMQVRGLKQPDGKRALVIPTKSKEQQLKDTSLGIAFEDASDEGTVNVKMTSDETKLLEPGRYTYDLQYKVNDKITTVLKGRFIVNQDISETL